MVTAALVIGVLWLVVFIAYFLLARLGSLVWDAVARLRR